MTEEIICSGFGGQGIMLMGKLLAEAALLEGKNVIWFPSYGAEVRGGAAFCMVKISDNEIASPFVAHADTCFAMNQLAVNKFSRRVKDNGLLLVNSSLATDVPELKNITVVALPLSDIAAGLGSIKVTNVVALGAYLARKKVIKAESIIAAMKEFAGEGKKHLLAINEKALKEGLSYDPR